MLGLLSCVVQLYLLLVTIKLLRSFIELSLIARWFSNFKCSFIFIITKCNNEENAQRACKLISLSGLRDIALIIITI